MSATILRADAAHLPIGDASVDLVVTSPPYFGLRSYTDGGVHYEGQVGDEATPGEYLDALTACTAEWMRALKPGGSIFVNLGDKYSGAQQQNSGKQSSLSSAEYWQRTKPSATGIPAKSLMLLPQRYAIRCIDDLGLILRAEIVWAKPNGLPESVTDRVRRSHEQVFHFVKQPRYFSAVDEVRESYEAPTATRTRGAKLHAWAREYGDPSESRNAADQMNPLGKLPGSVWSIPTSPLTVPDHLGIDHFAAYPPELVRRIILGWSPREVCTACGEGRRPEVLSQRHRNGVPVSGNLYGPSGKFATATGRGHIERTERVITGYTCACYPLQKPCGGMDECIVVGCVGETCASGDAGYAPATTPGVVLDPFGGTGTTALVASCYGRHGISVDLSADYCRLATWRTTDPGERARVLGVPKPPPQVDGQLGMFEGIGA